jgi:hypothetical protein
LREVIHPYVIFIPNVSVLSVGTPKKERDVQIYGNPRRVIRFYRRERTTGFNVCAMGSSRPMLGYHVEFSLC